MEPSYRVFKRRHYSWTSPSTCRYTPCMRPVDSPTPSSRRDLKTIRSLLPYLWEYRSRVLWAVGCLILAKAATVTIPLMLKGIVDQLDVARNPLRRPAGLPPPAPPRAPLPPRTPDRRRLARHRARLARHQLFAHLHAVQRAAHAGRDRPRRSDPAREIPDRLRRHHLRHRRPLHHLYADGDRVAHEVPSHHE